MRCFKAVELFCSLKSENIITMRELGEVEVSTTRTKVLLLSDATIVTLLKFHVHPVPASPESERVLGTRALSLSTKDANTLKFG